ncbi:MAG: thiamine pyrophosphate-dependent enzyme [Streptosporangiaceae bacterium]
MSTIRLTVGQAAAALDALADALAGWSAEPAHRDRAAELAAGWQATVQAAYDTRHQPQPAQAEVIGVVNEVSEDTDVVLCAAGSMPGDLHKLWRTRDPGGYHVEYGYSCMGYEIAGGLGARLGAPEREVFVMVGDGSYLMMASELVTAVQEGIKLVVVCVDNHGFASIGNLSESVGSQRFGTSYMFRGRDGRLDGGYLPVDLAANAASLGVDVLRAKSIEEFRQALVKARASDRTTLVHIETDPLLPAPSSDAWWDVPVAEVAGLDSTREARAAYEKARQRQRPYL